MQNGAILRQENNSNQLQLDNVKFRAEVFEVAADVTYLEGTLLGRDATTPFALVPYVEAGSGGEQIAVAVLPNTLTADGSGTDENIRAIVGGDLRLDKVFTALAPTALITLPEREELRQVGIYTVEVEELAAFDN